VALLLKAMTQILVIVDLAVKHEPQGAILVSDWLVAREQVNDAQPAHAQPDVGIGIVALVVGTAMV
jgi:hypothetical protein